MNVGNKIASKIRDYNIYLNKIWYRVQAPQY